ncbi:hypothetical protein NADE_000057 [Nannochloris sp. 'desiccata']|nr:hypothetical protein KSW81_005148 [Chlorella desiccata (nom. nud.)]KAH7617853.1 hypothetical protein NADE_000057 [Chlorella desiccata (nom. nud.)]
MNGDDSVSAPANLLPRKPQTAWQTEGPTPEDFKAFILNYVRDQAEFILSAAEKKGPTSRGGIPQPGLSNKLGSGAPVSRSKRTEAKHLRQLESVARRLDPGAVDETNFPSLGAGSSSITNSTIASANNGTQKPSSACAVGIAPKQMKRIIATPVAVGKDGAGGKINSSSGNTPTKRRIQPTQVAEVEVSKQFVTAHVSEPGPSGGALTSKMTPSLTSDTTAVATSKLASRLGAMGSHSDDNEYPFLTTNFSVASAITRGLAREVTPQKEALTLGSDSIGIKEFSTPLSNKLNFGEIPIPRCVSSTIAARAPPPAQASTSSPTLITAAGVVASSQTRSAPTLLPLSAPGHTLAALHAGILSTAADISLTTEVNLLLNLLAVPLTAEVDSSLVACPELGVLLTCGVQSQQYAALVLQHAGGLLKGLGMQLLEELVNATATTVTTLDESTTNSLQISENKSDTLLPSPIRVMEMFKETASAAESALRSRQLRTEKAFNRVTSAASRNSIAGGVGLHAFTADGVRSRSIEEQRRVSNREACRDAFFALMRDASSRAAYFGRNIQRRGGVSVSLSLVSGADGLSHSGEPDGVVFGRIQVSSSNLLRTLRPDNFLAFAELLTAAILQAAATGDALLDEELAKLAKRDGISRFHSLNRRMQGGEASGSGGGRGGSGGGGGPGSGAVGPRRGNPTALNRLNSSGSTSIGFGSTYNSTTIPSTTGAATTTTTLGSKKQPPNSPFKQNNSNASNSNKMQRGGVSCGGSGSASTSTTRYNNGHSNYISQLPAGAQAAMDEAAACAACIMSEFPHALSLYILFLEAADSHRLNTALTRVMTEKLKSLAKPQGTMAAAAGQSLGEKVVAASALAGILGYLAFAKNNANAKPVPWEEEEEEEENRKKNIIGRKYDGSHPVDVAGAVHASIGTSHVLRTIPWVTRYLHFLKWDSEASEAPYFRSLLSTLGDLKCAAELSPGGHGFGPAALCLRSLLDDFSATVLPLNPTRLEKCTGKTAGGNAAAPAVKTDFGTALASSDQLIDLRYVELCCPALAHARRLFASESGVVLRSEPRRILPTAPLATTSAGAPPLLLSKASAATGKASLLMSPSSSPDTLGGTTGDARKQEQQQKLTAAAGDAASSDLLATKMSTAVSSSTTGNSTTTASRTILDPVKLRLQQTFLRQYSQEDKLVKLKDVVDYCSDVIGCNAATATVAKLAPDAIKTASDDLVALITEYAEAATSRTGAPSIEQQQIQLERFSNAAAEKATAATIKRVLNDAYEAAQEPIKLASIRAILGLVSSELGDAVIATAAAMVAETAEEACCGRLPSLVQKAIRQDDLAGYAKSAVKAIIKERRNLQQSSGEPACIKP